jgi:RNA polymerase sigma factor (TIGR02999 family)
VRASPRYPPPPPDPPRPTPPGRDQRLVQTHHLSGGSAHSGLKPRALIRLCLAKRVFNVNLPSEPHTQSSITVLLNRWRRGDVDALGRVLAALMHELEVMSRARARGEDRQTMAPDDLLNEALVRAMEGQLRAEADLDAASAWQSRSHFLAHMSLHMRSVLIDRARARGSEKRGGGADHVTLSAAEAESREESVIDGVLALDEALNALANEDARAAEVLHLSAFGGLTREEIAEALSISVPTVDRDLRFARAWLASRLEWREG